MKQVCLASFYLCFAAAGVSALSATVGRADLTDVFAPLILVFAGVAVVTGMFVSARNYGGVDVAYFGRVTRQERPGLYWALTSVPIAWGLFMLGMGVWLLWT